MAERITVYIGEPLANVLAGYDDNRSGRINRVCADWLQMIEEARPELSEAEWMAVIDITNSTAIFDNDALRFIWADVADSPEECTKWGVDQDDLVGKLRGMSLSGLLAMRETIDRYWACCHDCGTHTEALRRIGAIGAGSA